MKDIDLSSIVMFDDIKKIDGKGTKWIVVDAKSIIIHIFNKEEREIYNLEKDEDKLSMIYNLGYQDASKLISKIKKYIGGNKSEK